jgi:hypothetical protein
MVSTDGNINRVLRQNKTGTHVVLATGNGAGNHEIELL